MQSIKKLQRSGVKNIALIGPIPTWNDTLAHQLTRNFSKRGLAIPQRTLVGINPASLASETRMRHLVLPDHVRYISLQDILCNQSGCMTTVGGDLSTDLMVFDYGHLTLAGADFVAKNAILPNLPIAY